MKTQKDYKGNLEGIDLLRDLVVACDSRNETLNDNKTPNQLVIEYVKSINNEDYNWWAGKNHED